MLRLVLRATSAASLLACSACAFDTSGAGTGDRGGTEGWHEDGSTTSAPPKPSDDTKDAHSGTADGPSETSPHGDDESTWGTTGADTDESETRSEPETDGRPPVPFCDATDPHLVACYTFTDIVGGVLNDGSSYGNTGSVHAVGFTNGPVGPAITFSRASRVEVPNSASLDLTTNMTLEAWVRVDQLPTIGRMGVVDNDGQYSIFVYPGAGLRCSAAHDLLFTPATANTWTHVACVLGNDGHRMYVDGVLTAQSGYAGPMPTDNLNPLAIGDDSPSFNEPLDGAVGALRIWSRAFDAAELCQAAGELCSQ